MERHGTYPDIGLGPDQVTISFDFIVEDAEGVKMVEDPFSALLANASAHSEIFIVVETSSFVVRRYLAQEHVDTHGASEFSPPFRRPPQRDERRHERGLLHPLRSQVLYSCSYRTVRGTP